MSHRLGFPTFWDTSCSQGSAEPFGSIPSELQVCKCLVLCLKSLPA
jgi:hypothetical protein